MIRNRKPRRIITPAKNISRRKTRIEKTYTKKKKSKKVTISTKVNIKKSPRVDLKRKPMNYSAVKPIFNGETVYIVGGGPSLNNFDWNKLKNRNTIVINKAFYNLPTSQVMYWTDSRFYTWYKTDIDKFKGLKYTIRRSNYDENVMLLKKGPKHGLSILKDTLAHGNNSGYAAINLAYLLGAKKIILLGFDMGNNTNGKSHFHDGYPTKATSNEVYQKQFIPGFDSLWAALKEKGINVYNACPTSNLKVFPFISIERALALR